MIPTPGHSSWPSGHATEAYLTCELLQSLLPHGSKYREQLERLAARIDAPLAQLVAGAGGPADRPDMTYAQMITPEGLKAMAAYAAWVAPEMILVLPRDAEGRTTAPSALVTDAHTAGLKVVVWTLRAENAFLPAERRRGEGLAQHGDMAAYAAAFAEAEVDAIFSDFPALARAGL